MTSLSKCMYSACVSYVHKTKRKRGIEVRAFFVVFCLWFIYILVFSTPISPNTTLLVFEGYISTYSRAWAILYAMLPSAIVLESQLYVLFSDGQSATKGDWGKPLKTLGKECLTALSTMSDCLSRKGENVWFCKHELIMSSQIDMKSCRSCSNQTSWWPVIYTYFN